MLRRPVEPTVFYIKNLENFSFSQIGENPLLVFSKKKLKDHTNKQKMETIKKKKFLSKIENTKENIYPDIMTIFRAVFSNVSVFFHNS